MKPILIKPHGEPGNFSMTCTTKRHLKETKEMMAFKGFLPIEMFNQATETGVEYVLVYSIRDKVFFPLCFN